MEIAHLRLVKLLQLAYSAEKAAAFAYRRSRPESPTRPISPARTWRVG